MQPKTNDSSTPFGNGTHPTHSVALGNSELRVSRIGLGCWPMSGISSIGINDADSVATIHAALDCGINFFDTAYSYGYDGRSDHVLRTALRNKRSQAVIAHKVGMSWDADRKRVIDGRPSNLLQQARECLQRLNVDYVDVMYLHTPDVNVPIEESAGAISEICNLGMARYAGVSNVNSVQALQFISVCPVVAIQPYFNMFQQDAVNDLFHVAQTNNITLVCYWVLMKGLLSGKLLRDHVFAPDDRRLTYPVFQGQEWQRAQDLLDRLRLLSNELHCTVAQLVTAWSLKVPGVGVALLGAKRPDQMMESAQALHVHLSDDVVQTISHWCKSE
jgi:aryl-alcohol dehydrogenase-like predicted oxidoreductase